MKTSQGQKQGSAVDAGKGRPNAIYRELESFASCIRDGKRPDVDVEVGRNAARSVLNANKAMEEGRVVKIS